MSGECETCGEHVLDCKCGKKMGCDGSCFMCNIHKNIGKEMEKIKYKKMGFVRTLEDTWLNLDYIRGVEISKKVNDYYIYLIDVSYNSFKIAGPFDTAISAMRAMDEFMENMGNEKKSRKTPEKQTTVQSECGSYDSLTHKSSCARPKKAKKTPEKEPVLPSEWGKVDSMIPASPFLATKKKAKK